MKEKGKFYMNPNSGSVFLCTKDSKDSLFEGVCVKAPIVNKMGEFSDFWGSNIMVEVIPTDEFKFERKKEIPEYTMEEAIEKMGHEFKIKKSN